MSTNPSVNESPISGLALLASLFKTDPTKEEAGTWMPVAGDVEICVRSQQSESARTVSKALLQRHRAALSVGASLTPEQNKQFEIDFVSQALVVDWRGMTEPGGASIACSEPNVRQIVTDLPRLRQQILAYAESLENYRPEKPAADQQRIGVVEQPQIPADTGAEAQQG
jgi:hypothetical protein